MATKSRASSLAFTFVAITAVALCVRLGIWQLDRYHLRHQLTTQISTAIAQKPVTLTSSNQRTVSTWAKVKISGRYDADSQVAFRGHYFQNRYGLEVLTLFKPDDPDIPPIWVDRGWIQARAGASSKVQLPAPSSEPVSITGILKAYDSAAAARGVFFALPAPRIGRINEATLQKSFSGETFYRYLILSDDSQLSSTGLSIAPLTPPGDGPHLAYAIQWWVFALLIGITRVALFRQERS